MQEKKPVYNGYEERYLSGVELKELFKDHYYATGRHHSVILGLSIPDFLELKGISDSKEYRIFVKPSCKNTIAELSSYCWKKDKSDNGINVPEDTNNHLMDAMRYAFYDVRFFRPDNSPKKRPNSMEYYNIYNGLRAGDIGGI